MYRYMQKSLFKMMVMIFTCCLSYLCMYVFNSEVRTLMYSHFLGKNMQNSNKYEHNKFYWGKNHPWTISCNEMIKLMN